MSYFDPSLYKTVFKPSQDTISEVTDRVGFIESAKAMNYNPGYPFKAFGEAREIPYEGFQALGANRHYVNGDGSCWSRALWQCVFSQIFQSDEVFDAFINRIATPEKVKDHEITLNEARAKETIHILHQLKNMSPEERLNYLNQSEVDNSLVFFMRDVASEYMKYAWDSPDNECHDIKTNKNRYGAKEITAFANYFQLQLHRIAQNSDKDRTWTYYYYDGVTRTGTSKKIADLTDQEVPIPHNCMFGANDKHYEFISFNRLFPTTCPPDVLGQSFAKLASEIEEQVESDHALALKLYEELNASLLETKNNPEASKVLRQNYKENLAKKTGLDDSTLFTGASLTTKTLEVGIGDQLSRNGAVEVEKEKAKTEALIPTTPKEEPPFKPEPPVIEPQPSLRFFGSIFSAIGSFFKNIADFFRGLGR